MLSLYIDISEEEISASLGAPTSNPDKKADKNSADKKTFVGWSSVNTDTATPIKDRLSALLKLTKTEGIQTMNRALPQEKSKAVQNIHVWLSSPEVMVQTKRVGISQEKPFLIKPEYIARMKKEAGDAFKNTAKGGVFEQIEEQVSAITLDGYTTSEPLKKQAKHLSFTLYQAFADTNYVSDITNTIHGIFGNVTPSFHARVHAYALAGYNLVHPIEDFMVVDISEKTTGIIIIHKDGHVVGGHSVSGKDAIIDHVSKQTKTTFDAAQSLLELYAQNALHEELTDQMLKAIKDAQQDWTKDFSSLIASLCQGETVPRRIIFIKENLSPLFKKWIEDDQFSKTYMSGEGSLIELNSSQFTESVIFQDDINISEGIKVKTAVEITSVNSTIIQ